MPSAGVNVNTDASSGAEDELGFGFGAGVGDSDLLSPICIREPLRLPGLERGRAHPCLPWLLLTLYHVQLPALSALQVQAATVRREEGRVDVSLAVCVWS